MIERANLVREVITDRGNQNNEGIDLADILPAGADPVNGPTPAEVVDAMATRLSVDLTPAERGQLTTYLDTDMDNGGNIITDQPFDPSNAQHIDERVRGLLYIMSQHPSFHVR